MQMRNNKPFASSIARRRFVQGAGAAALTNGISRALAAMSWESDHVNLQVVTSESINVGTGVNRPSIEPRPFYIFGHNPNSIADVNAALDAGANAIEPDVNIFAGQPRRLCISHDVGNEDTPSLEDYLSALGEVALHRPELSLVLFDCKPDVATPELGLKLLEAFRTHLAGSGLNVVISVSSCRGLPIFESILHQLGSREGLMIDEENDPLEVSSFFTKAGVENQCFGNGSTVQSPLLSPHIRPSIEQACAQRAMKGGLKFIYVWTVNDVDRLREYIRIGVDGIITDEVSKLRKITAEDEFRTLIRVAKRSDNPFTPIDAAYGLKVHTGDIPNAGTDANVTFTLTGGQGVASVTIDTSLCGGLSGNGRMERNTWDFVTLQSPDLGNLSTITLQRDNSGWAPDWFLDRIAVESFRYSASKQASFNRWIDTTAPFTAALM